jgi:hypothetical protein
MASVSEAEARRAKNKIEVLLAFPSISGSLSERQIYRSRQIEYNNEKREWINAVLG